MLTLLTNALFDNQANVLKQFNSNLTFRKKIINLLGLKKQTSKSKRGSNFCC